MSQPVSLLLRLLLRPCLYVVVLCRAALAILRRSISPGRWEEERPHQPRSPLSRPSPPPPPSSSSATTTFYQPKMGNLEVETQVRTWRTELIASLEADDGSGERRGSFETHMIENLIHKTFTLLTSPTSPSPTADDDANVGGHSMVRVLSSVHCSVGVPKKCLTTIDSATKTKLLSRYLPVPHAKIMEAASVLYRLANLSPDTAASFGPKTGSRDELTLRLLFPPRQDGSDTPPDPIRGYYALSYRWQSAPRIVNHRRCSHLSHEKYIATPTSDVMFEAILQELPIENGYGLWCDQLCINEADDDERNTTVAMMDSIYRAAAKVIIALDDIEIGADEMCAMVEFGEWHELHTGQGRVPEDVDFQYMRTRPGLRACVEKIISSEYFDRAWCGHEFELAPDRVVLVRAAQDDGEEDYHVLRIEDAKLHTLMLLLTLDKRKVSPEQAVRQVNVELLVSRADRDDPETHSQLVHDMQTLALITSMQTGGDPTLPDDLRPYSALKDKLSIMLNATDMALRPSDRLDLNKLSLGMAHSRTYQYVSLLMLAAGNPLPLATTGRALHADEQNESWLRKFWLLDAGIALELPPLPMPLNIRLDPSPGCAWIELDMLVPASGGRLHRASPKYVKYATAFMEEYRQTHDDDGLEGPSPEVEDARREYITQLMACVLECREGAKGGKKENWKSDWHKVTVSGAAPWQYFFGENLDELPDTIGKKKDEEEQKTALGMASQLMSGLLMTAPMPDTRADAAAWRPTWFQLGDDGDGGANGCGGSGPRYVAMAPRDDGEYRAAVPDLLRPAAYASLARCWILEDNNAEGNYENCWIVRNRCKLRMDADTLDGEYDDDLWRLQPAQRIRGRAFSSDNADLEHSDDLWEIRPAQQAWKGGNRLLQKA